MDSTAPVTINDRKLPLIYVEESCKKKSHVSTGVKLVKLKKEFHSQHLYGVSAHQPDWTPVRRQCFYTAVVTIIHYFSEKDSHK